ncbi:sensory rhodopsin transducer [Pseudoclostridium thermosuccinogenes]|uniref:sensory rhodopsin transducer n=1 Tax=Clostridium thermosuccinogenes TaxID=84032 RepID=UPI002FD91A51
MNKKIGSKVWFIPDGFYPPISNGAYPSHEAICVLNPGDRDANIEITLFFEDRDKMGGFRQVCKAERTNHIRMDKLKIEKGEGVPQGVAYAMMVESDQNIIVQYSRMDTTQAEMALMTTIAYPLD